MQDSVVWRYDLSNVAPRVTVHLSYRLKPKGHVISCTCDVELGNLFTLHLRPSGRQISYPKGTQSPSQSTTSNHAPKNKHMPRLYANPDKFRPHLISQTREIRIRVAVHLSLPQIGRWDTNSFQCDERGRVSAIVPTLCMKRRAEQK